MRNPLRTIGDINQTTLTTAIIAVVDKIVRTEIHTTVVEMIAHALAAPTKEALERKSRNYI
jgi:hypothetical protein